MVDILCDIGDETEVINEERQDWLQRVLVALGANEEVISENTLEAKEHIMFLGLDVFTNVDGTIKIYRPEYVTFELSDDEEVTIETNQRLVAEWKKPKLIRIREGKEEYYKIIINEWALPLMEK